MNYEKKKLKDCCISISDGDHQAPPKTETGIPFITISNIGGNNQLDFSNVMYVPEEYYENILANKKASIGDILYSVVGSFGKPVYISSDKKFVFQRHIAILKPNKDIDGKYLYYTMLDPIFYHKVDKLAIGCAQRTITLDTLRNIVIDVPPLEKQKSITKVLRVIDAKIAINNRINDNLQQQQSLIYEDMMAKALSERIAGTFTVAKNLSTVITGKEDANFSTSNGKYKFFTCSNEPLRCDEFVFDSSSILIAGNGDFNVKHYTGRFNAYQRTYVLTPPIKYYALLYLASLYRINSFKSNSSGSIVKFITKGDVENIPVFIPDDYTYLQALNVLTQLQEQNQYENEKLLQLRDWLLPLLMNGQATITD